MAVSQNGWTLISASQLNTSPFPGTKIVPVPGIRQGDVRVVLHYLGSQFNKRVEKLVNPGCWGWNRAEVIPGGVSYSNHASGTAVDLNAPQHPWQIKGTFTAAQVRAIRNILKECGGVIRWGGDYTRVDEMHFEINANASKVKLVADKIRKGIQPMIDKHALDVLFRFRLGQAATKEQVNKYVGKITFDALDKKLLASLSYAASKRQFKAGTKPATDFLARDLIK